MQEQQDQGLNKIVELIENYFSGRLSNEPMSVEEEAELSQWLSQGELREELLRQFSDGKTLNKLLDYCALFDSIKETERERLHDAKNPVRKLPNRIWSISLLVKWAAASLLLILTAAGGYYYLHHGASAKDGQAVAPNSTDVLPGGDKAILTLGNGKRIILDSVAKGELAQQSATRVVKSTEGSITYQERAQDDAAIEYNTITTPKKGQYQVTLSDGTKVWLNSASSLRYPTRFSGNERRVTLTGEGFFQVSHRAATNHTIKEHLYAQSVPAPFIVEAGNTSIDVLATQFNVNAYDDEPTLKATLLEGAVRINTGVQTEILRPGEQAQVESSGKFSVAIADTDQAVAWKDGVFNFDHTDLYSALRQIARWYDVEILYEGKVPNKMLIGYLHRDTKLSVLLQVLGKVNVHTRLDGQKLIITP